MQEALKIMRGMAVALVIVLYAVLVHHVNASGQVSLLGALLALAPLLLITVTFSWSITSKLIGFSLVMAFCIIAWWTLPFIEQHTGLIFWLQDIGLMLILLVTFARTLLPSRKPLCAHFAEMINGGTLPIAHERYAYKVTVAWVGFFALMVLISSLLFFFSPLATWSLFVNFLTLPLVALMFIAEFMVRKQVLTDLPTGNVLDAVRAYLNNSKNNSKRTH
ncbi:MAG: hypothetical protein H0W85_10395 [Methylotenera sp.]|nr:hypothetical protein [Methylotenera sp.]